MKIQGVVNASSQSEVLKSRMTKENLTHGQTVRADIPNVKVGEPVEGMFGFFLRSAPVFFCNIGGLSVKEQLSPGDGGQLPSRVVVKGLAVDSPGFINIENAIISSNGSITVTLDEKSRAVRLET